MVNMQIMQFMRQVQLLNPTGEEEGKEQDALFESRAAGGLTHYGQACLPAMQFLLSTL